MDSPGQAPVVGAELARLVEARAGVPWRQWGPYLSERQWGTVREDYSFDGDAWGYFSHDQARSRAYRWGEDGLAGFSDDRAMLCFAIALWNGHDPILKERVFGLTNREGNHGEDAKEYYYYLDSTPTHSYLRYRYRYPQAAYPYDDLVRTNARRGRHDFEYELLDTGVFDGDRYFDVDVEYAKVAPDDICIRISVANRGPHAAPLELLPTLWFRNTWSWGDMVERPSLRAAGTDRLLAEHMLLGTWTLAAEEPTELLFTENETNLERLAGVPNRTPYVKDAFDNYLVHGRRDAINPAHLGTKAAVRYRLSVPGHGTVSVRLRLAARPTADALDMGDVDAIVALRRSEADEFYASVIPANLDADDALVMRQALAGMLWSKQYYGYDVRRWLGEHGIDRFALNGHGGSLRNERWSHMENQDVISMPDKWEYPWYAAWDLAFHVIALTLVDEDFAKRQLELILRDDYLHPNGQLPAYEWNFSDVNPPVHAWATIFTYLLEQRKHGRGDVDWLERIFQKLLINFTWWVNRKDQEGNNLFEGGFLGLDNIGVFDRSAPLPMGGSLEQADGTAWMALFCQNMLEIAAALSLERPAYLEMVRKFTEHFLWIATALAHAGADTGMWDEEDGFFYDVLRLPDGSAQRLKVRSMVGLMPLCAVTVFDGALLTRFPELTLRLGHFLEAHPETRTAIHDPARPGVAGRRMAAVLDEVRLRRVLARMLDESEFLSPFGIRSLSRQHEDEPYTVSLDGQAFSVAYLPAESDSGMFGGNSNWRGPVWMPVNALIIRALLQYHSYYGEAFTVECPTGSGHQMTLYGVAEEIGRRLGAIFRLDEYGRRPVFGGSPRFHENASWRDDLLFYEYFHGDNGAGLGASHQTGWTGVIARILHLFATTSADEIVAEGLSAALEV